MDTSTYSETGTRTFEDAQQVVAGVQQAHQAQVGQATGTCAGVGAGKGRGAKVPPSSHEVEDEANEQDTPASKLSAYLNFHREEDLTNRQYKMVFRAITWLEDNPEACDEQLTTVHAKLRNAMDQEYAKASSQEYAKATLQEPAQRETGGAASAAPRPGDGHAVRRVLPSRSVGGAG